MVCFFWTRGADLCGVVDESLQLSSTLVGDREGKYPVAEQSGGGGGKKRVRNEEARQLESLATETLSKRRVES